MSATQEIWRFFRRHRLIKTTDVKSIGVQTTPPWFYPNPASSFIRLTEDGGATITNLNGNILLRASGREIDLRNLPKGTYLLQSRARSATILKD